MSQLTATARPLHGPGHPDRSGGRSASVTPLRVIPARITSPGNGAFATMCVALLTAGLIALLLLNTALAQGSLELDQLQRQSSALSDTASNLQEQIDQASSSGALAKKAAQLGMVRANERAYIDVAKGKVTGTAYPASKAQAFPVITSPTPVPKPAKTATPAPAAAAPAAAAPATPTAVSPTATPKNPATGPTATSTGTPSPSASQTATSAPAPSATSASATSTSTTTR